MRTEKQLKAHKRSYALFRVQGMRGHILSLMCDIDDPEIRIWLVNVENDIDMLIDKLKSWNPNEM